MYKVLAFKRADGEVPFRQFADEVRRFGEKVNLTRIQRYVDDLGERGFSLQDIGHLEKVEEDLYELRPKPYRVFVCWHKAERAFYLLNGFRKKTQRTPESEKDRARHLKRELLANIH